MPAVACLHRADNMEYYLIVIAPGDSRNRAATKIIRYTLQHLYCMFVHVMLCKQILTFREHMRLCVCIWHVCVHIMKKTEALGCQVHLKA